VRPHDVGLKEKIINMKQTFSDLWQGDIILWKTFWLFGVAILSVLLQLLPILAGLVGGLLNVPQGVFLIFVSLLATIFMAYGVFVAIAVKRSADKYQGPPIWAHLAKVIMTLLVIIIVFFNLQGIFTEIKSLVNQGPVRLP